MSAVTSTAGAMSSRNSLQDFEETTISDLLAILRRHRVIIASIILLVTIPSALYGLLRAPSYTAVAQMVIESQPSLTISAGPNGTELARLPPNLETQANVIRSHPMIIQALEELDLFQDPEFVLAENALAAQNSSIWSSTAAKAVASLNSLKIWWQEIAGNPVAAVKTEPGSPESEKAKRVNWKVFDENLNVRNLENSYVIEVAFTSSNAAKAAAIANNLANLYVQNRLESKIQTARKENAWTAKRVQTQQRSVMSVERRIAVLRSQRQFVAGRGAVLTQSELEELNQELIRLASARAKIDAKFTFAKKQLESGGRLQTFNEVIASPIIAQLRIQEMELTRRVAESAVIYGKLNPRTLAAQKDLADVVARAKQETDNIVAGLRNELDALSAQAQAVELLLQAAQKKNAADNMAAVEIQDLERDAAAKRSVYENLLVRYQEARGVLETFDPGARVISAAEVPILPSSLGPASIAAVGFVFSSLLGCSLALRREFTDNKLRSHRQVAQSLQLPCLGLVPNIGKLPPGPVPNEFLNRNPRSAYAQSIRGIYTQLSVAAPEAQVILVSSALRKEGKTRLAVDIAMCAAQEGQRTVLVDFDNYRPMVTKSLGLDAAPLSVDLFSVGGKTVQNLEQALILDQAAGIDILAMGSRALVARPFLGSQKIETLIKELRNRYQLIVIDSPPLLGVSDGRVLATFADATLLVVQWGSTDRAAAATAVQMLRSVSANVVGVVLTQVNLKKLAHHGGGDGLQYRRSFQYYHAG